jgi:Uma2 family endonuclease
MVVSKLPAEQRLRLSSIPWETYIAYSDGLGPRHIRVTYDRGEMEVTTLSPRHENRKKLLGRLVEALTEEMNIEIACFGSMTCRREELQRGLEADDSYWIENEALVRGREDIDLEVDPPPDLVLEIEISRSTIDVLRFMLPCVSRKCGAGTARS